MFCSKMPDILVQSSDQTHSSGSCSSEANERNVTTAISVITRATAEKIERSFGSMIPKESARTIDSVPSIPAAKAGKGVNSPMISTRKPVTRH